MSGTVEFPITIMLQRIAELVGRFPKAAMFELVERGFNSVFEQLAACVISIRTLDETTIPVAEKLFAQARTPEEILALSRETLIELLEGSTFPGQKADTIFHAARLALDSYDGSLPADFDVLTSIKGVGPKCANLTLGVAGGKAAISVDSHVHRVVNRWGMVRTSTPEKTLSALEEIVPHDMWTDINRLVMPFGKFHCTWRLPHCSTCPVIEWCHRVGVTRHN